MRAAAADALGDIAFNRIWLAWIRYLQRDGEEAALLLAGALIHASTIGDLALTDGLRLAACLAADSGDGAAAAALFGAAENAAKGQREWPYQTTGRLIAEPKVRAAAADAFDSDRRRGRELDIPGAIELAQQAADGQDAVAS